jgi:undecaprenyl-diphosphatase
VDSLTAAIIAGLLQGLLEWLPVSSEGNMVILLTQMFGYGVEETLNTSIFLHLGTGLAALVYFREPVLSILLMKTPEDRDMFYRLLVMTGLTGLVGFPIFMFFNVSASIGETLLALTGIALILTGLLQRRTSKSSRVGAELSWPLTILLGVAQGFAIIPGLSRSGLTTSIMLFKDFDGEEAFRVSFLMSIPASFAAAFGLMLVKGFQPDAYSGLAALIAAVVGYLTIGRLLALTKEVSFWKICVGLGALAILAWLPNLAF